MGGKKGTGPPPGKKKRTESGTPLEAAAKSAGGGLGTEEANV